MKSGGPLPGVQFEESAEPGFVMDCNTIIQIASQDSNSTASELFLNLDYNSFISAIIGGLLAGGFTLIGVYLTHRNDIKKQKKKTTEDIIAFYQAIFTEVETSWVRYMAGIGKTIEDMKDNDPFFVVTSFKRNPFPVYDSMVNFVGMLSNEVLRKKIIYTYAIWESHLEDLSRHSEEVKKYDNLVSSDDAVINERRNKRAEEQYHILIKHAKRINKTHLDLKQSVAILKKSLEEALSKQKVQ